MTKTNTKTQTKKGENYKEERVLGAAIYLYEYHESIVAKTKTKTKTRWDPSEFCTVNYV